MKNYIDILIKRYAELEEIQADIVQAYQILKDCYQNKGKVLVGGNGGSQADSEHIVGELMKGFVKKRPLPLEMQKKLQEIGGECGESLANSLQVPLEAIAVTGHQGLSSAFANDVDPNMVYAQQVLGYGRTGDVFLAISTSGNAKNLIYATIVAKAKGLKVILLTGKDGGKIRKLADISMIVPSYETYEIQERHLPIYHALCLQLEEDFFRE